MRNLRRLKIKDVTEKVGLSKAKIYMMIKNDEFPEQVKDGYSSFWFEHEIDEWLIERHNLDESTLA